MEASFQIAPDHANLILLGDVMREQKEFPKYIAMLNEAVAALREGVIEDGDLLDAAAIFATGFAPFRGGPLQYAKTRGVREITRRLEELTQRYGERFRADAGWSRMGSTG